VTKIVTNGMSKAVYKKSKKLETLDTQGLQASRSDDSDWARTSDLHPVKVALSQLSYGIMLFC
jgi:hypothetical protein